MNEEAIRKAINEYTFYHIIKLADNIYTPGVHKFVPAQNLCMKHLRSLDMKGKRVLDIGCADGLFSFEAESMGAEEVVSIDNELSKPATEFLIPFFKSKIKMMQMNLYDIRREELGQFDIIIFPGVLYHLRYPLWGLKVIRDVLKENGHLIIETAIWRGEWNNAMLFCPVGDESPYEESSCSFFNEKGLIDTLGSLGFTTVSVEYLKPTGMEGIKRGLRDLKTRLSSQLRMSVLPENRPQIKQVTRGVFHSVLSGYDKEASLSHYWNDVVHSRRTFLLKRRRRREASSGDGT